ncbi:SIR2 family NAD-dependent protein deacylase [Pseudomonas syringae pv. coryli]|uniref:SIR2 family NAD-dependent protein deacylase n=1 Tax=Pseudomonas syringae pv. coryli TaxID=317659 RepID=UPI00061920F0|nr:NAD-dependent deacylase [Pseudomonas syringae pv. coryli]
MTDMALAAAALRAARRVVVFTGAGISAESGIPTFRDKQSGLWSVYDSRQLETADAFRENPELVWGFYLWRRQQAKSAEPNAAHLALSRLAATERHLAVVTQNIDDLHERAGTKEVIHLHGSLEVPKCFACARPAKLTMTQTTDPAEVLEIEPPRCLRCNGRLRPGIVWFKEDLPLGAWKASMAMVRQCDVLISVGTSGVVTPAADIPEIAHTAGATVIHVNLVDVSLGGSRELMLIGKASEVLPTLVTSAQ